MCKCKSMGTFRDQRRTSDSLFYHFSMYYSLETRCLVKSLGVCAPTIYSAGFIRVCSQVAFLFLLVCYGNSNPGPHACTASILMHWVISPESLSMSYSEENSLEGLVCWDHLWFSMASLLEGTVPDHRASLHTWAAASFVVHFHEGGGAFATWFSA